MPNQRDPRKRKVGVFLLPAERRRLKKAAQIAGLSVSDLLKQLVDDEVARQTKATRPKTKTKTKVLA